MRDSPFPLMTSVSAMSLSCRHELFHRHLLFIECFKLLSPDLEETWTLMRTHQRPVLILFHATHKEVWNPEPKKQVSGTVFLSTGVLAAIQVLENVRMPWLQVYRKGSRTLKQYRNINNRITLFCWCLCKNNKLLYKNHQQLHITMAGYSILGFYPVKVITHSFKFIRTWNSFT